MKSIIWIYNGERYMNALTDYSFELAWYEYDCECFMQKVERAKEEGWYCEDDFACEELRLQDSPQKPSITDYDKGGIVLPGVTKEDALKFLLELNPNWKEVQGEDLIFKVGSNPIWVGIEQHDDDWFDNNRPEYTIEIEDTSFKGRAYFGIRRNLEDQLRDIIFPGQSSKKLEIADSERLIRVVDQK